MNGPKEKPEPELEHEVGSSHIDHMEKHVDKHHPNHPNGAESGEPQKDHLFLGKDHKVNR